jgi:pilus assembly protein Flp/PilA
MTRPSAGAMLRAARRYARPEIHRKGGTNHMSELITFISSYISTDEEGQGLAEYALILALIAIVAIVALIFLGTQVSGILGKVGSSV